MSHPLVAQLLALAGGQGVVLVHRQRAWASITFSGERHVITLAFTGAEAVAGGERLWRILASHDFDLPGQLVVDLLAVETARISLPQPQLDLTIEALLLDQPE